MDNIQKNHDTEPIRVAVFFCSVFVITITAILLVFSKPMENTIYVIFSNENKKERDTVVNQIRNNHEGQVFTIIRWNGRTNKMIDE
jgi:hypothetical protein